MNTKISFFNNVYSKKMAKLIGMNTFLEQVKNGEWQDYVLDVRTQKKEKKHAPAVTLSGFFSDNRVAKNITEHSGFIQIDIDTKDQFDGFNIEREQICNDEYTYALFDSISGNGGFKILVRVDAAKHLDAFNGLKSYYLKHYNVVIDNSCSDVSRLCYVSYDPYLFLNEKAKIFKLYPKKEEKIYQKNITALKNHIYIKDDFDDAVNQARHMNLFDSYEDYLTCAFALQNKFGTSGEDYFHTLVSGSSKYDSEKASKHYQGICKRNGNTGITIASLLYIFKQNNISIKSEKTKKIEKLVKLSDNPVDELKKLGVENAEEVAKDFEQKDENKEQTELELISELIKMENVKFNEVLRNYEFNGKIMNDRILAEFYAKVWEKIDDKITTNKIFTLIQSPKNHTSYHPIKEWFQKNKDISCGNEFEQLLDCFVVNMKIWVDNQEIATNDYLEVYLKKWLLSIIASAHGTYSLMILVLIGKQGTNKTNFFRGLLPKDLLSFYADNTLDEGKDSEILMCLKLLIIDDEFGGKSKKDANKLKRLSSQQTFSIRMPYGRVTEELQRLAVLGGTSNELEVINDPTGNRRVIPVNLVSFNKEKFDKIDKTKLFIGLYKEWLTDKEKFFLTKDEIEILNSCTIPNQESLIEEELILKHIRPSSSSYQHMTTSEILIALVEKYPSIKTNNKRVGSILNKLGYRNRLNRNGGGVSRVYDVMWV